ncbi:FAD-dependent oxidoreductase [Flavobacterium humi]|uniref:FAD-dependent oxidoreductase n=1 Tax=Flavobacterium humi TaxID=2562683 RepID=A0A4Z0LCA8_9FLAO|nr:FAD-dependent oxidoreductase [Flavobacterium humi]TGD59503.1 FAD-dependent oxidoreductase [Flavobacterium humi]
METADPIDENITNGTLHSFWIDTMMPLAYRKIDQDKTTDVLVIGGGIAGLTSAYCLAQSGKKVILLEKGYLGSGETGRTTAHITYALDDRYYDLEKIFGYEKTKLIAESHKYALHWIESTINSEKIDCNFKNVDGYLFSDPSDPEENLQKEFEETQKIGLPTEMLPGIPYYSTDNKRNCIQFPKQGQFHILKYCKGLADAFIRLGGEIYTESKASAISHTGATSNGFAIRANHIIVATNSPVNDIVTMHTKQWAYRTYVIAAKIPKGKLPYALWWDTGNQNSQWMKKPYHYVRLESFDDQHDLLISGGEDHKTGLAGDEHISEAQRFENLEDWTILHFPYFSEADYKWSGQIIEPIDAVAFIGRNPGDKNIYIITGDSGNGMTHGTIGGLLIHDLILGNKNPWEDIYNPSRITIQTGDDYIKEVGHMVVNLTKGWLSSGDTPEASMLPAGKGAILSHGLEKIALYRDEQGKLHSCSAVCPHLGGIVQWNDEEKSFDCPLHGSRFTPFGKVISGPAKTDLKPKSIT